MIDNRVDLKNLPSDGQACLLVREEGLAWSSESEKGVTICRIDINAQSRIKVSLSCLKELPRSGVTMKLMI